MAATVFDALLALTPTAKFGVRDNTYAGIDWYSSDIAQPSEAEVNAEMATLDAQEPLDACKKQASYLLYQTDWTTIADVSDPAKSNPHLANSAEFNTYRNAVRQYAINPVANPTWPTQPTAQWSST